MESTEDTRGDGTPTQTPRGSAECPSDCPHWTCVCRTPAVRQAGRALLRGGQSSFGHTHLLIPVVTRRCDRWSRSRQLMAALS